MTKQSKIKGKVWLPRSIVKNPRIRREFKAAKPHKHRNVVTERIGHPHHTAVFAHGKFVEGLRT